MSRLRMRALFSISSWSALFPTLGAKRTIIIIIVVVQWITNYGKEAWETTEPLHYYLDRFFYPLSFLSEMVIFHFTRLLHIVTSSLFTRLLVFFHYY